MSLWEGKTGVLLCTPLITGIRSFPGHSLARKKRVVMSTLVVSLHVFTAFRWVLVLYSRNKLLRQCGAKNIPCGQAMCSKRQPGLVAFPVLPARHAKPGHSWLPVWTETKRKRPAGCTQGIGSKLVLLMMQEQGDGALSFLQRFGRDQITESRCTMNGSWACLGCRFVLFGLVLFGLHHILNLN